MTKESKELPVLPAQVSARVWIGSHWVDGNEMQYVYSEDGDGEPLYTAEQLQAYGTACAAHALQRINELELDLDVQAGSIEAVQAANVRQAERIKELEGDVVYLQNDINAMCNAIPNYHWSGGAAELIAKCFAERDTLRAQLAALEADYAETRDELQDANDSLASTYYILGERDAQLAEITATEPVGTVTDNFKTDYSEISRTYEKPIPIGTKLFTHPMPAQDVTELPPITRTNAGDILESIIQHQARTALSKYKGAK